MADIFIFDRKQQLIKRVKSNKIAALVQTKEITSNKSELLNDTLEASIVYDKYLEENGRFMAIREEDGKTFSLYRTLQPKTNGRLLSLTGVNFGSDELDGYVVQDVRPENENIRHLIERLFEVSGCDTWEFNFECVESGITDSFYYMTLRECLKQIQTHGFEFSFTCDVSGTGISRKILNVYNSIGVNKGTRYTYGEKALTVEKEIDRTNIVTSFIGRGRGEEVGDGYGRRIEFADVVWEKAKGDPLDKPKGQIFLEDPKATEEYGIPTDKGMRKREKVVIFEDCEDPVELLKLTYDALVENQRPLVQFRATILGSDDIGDTITIHRHDRGYHYETRIFKVTKDFVAGTKTAELGDNISSSSQSSTISLATKVSDIQEKKMTFYQATEIGKFQDDIMRGAGTGGGSIYQVNGIEAGVSNSREVYETVYMNGPNIENSEHFMIQNSHGISFKHCKKGDWKKIQDVHNGESNTAWTLDGTFNANFIMAGILKGILVEGTIVKSFEKDEHYQMVLNGGELRVQYTKPTPDEINYKDDKWKEEVEGETVCLFKGTRDMQDKLNGAAIVQCEGQIFSINSNKKTTGASTPIFQIPSESNSDKRKYKLFGDGKFSSGTVTFEERVNLSEDTYIGDKKLIDYIRSVTPGQGGGPSGGGGSTGGTPSELKTEEEKRAWRIYDILVANYKYTKEAACGILGNIQQETAGTFNPDIDQIGGPAYGLVQWDGSAYPLVGSPTNNGREYVQNLMKAAGIKDDYQTIGAQVQLIQWCMYNGQWIGQVDPTQVEAFMSLGSPEKAAYAFEMNFERPAAAHPERQTYARNWYNKFKDLKPVTSTGEEGLKHLEGLLNTRIGNGQCYALSAEFSGVLGGCGLGAGTRYSISHVLPGGNTSRACDIGSCYDWESVGWKVIFNPKYDQLVVGSIINWQAGGQVDNWFSDSYYGHTGVIRGLDNGRIQTYEQNVTGTAAGMVCTKQDRPFYGSIASICIPPQKEKGV